MFTAIVDLHIIQIDFEVRNKRGHHIIDLKKIEKAFLRTGPPLADTCGIKQQVKSPVCGPGGVSLLYNMRLGLPLSCPD